MTILRQKILSCPIASPSIDAAALGCETASQQLRRRRSKSREDARNSSSGRVTRIFIRNSSAGRNTPLSHSHASLGHSDGALEAFSRGVASVALRHASEGWRYELRTSKLTIVDDDTCSFYSGNETMQNTMQHIVGKSTE